MEKLDDLVEKMLENEMLKSKILENLENIKCNKDFSLIDFSFEMKDIDVAGMEIENVVLCKFMWNDIAKLNIDLLLHFDYYKQFQFKSRYDLPVYKNILKLMGYNYSHKLWICCSSPDKNIAIKSILYSKLFDEVYKEKLTLTENEEFFNKLNIENYFNSVFLKSKGKVMNKCDKICKICDSLNENFEAICSFCEYPFSSEDEEEQQLDTIDVNLNEFCDNEKENEINENPQIINLDNIDYYSSVFEPKESNEITVVVENENNNQTKDLPLNESQFVESLVDDDDGCVATECQLTNRNLDGINNAHWECTHCTFINENTIDNCLACQFAKSFKYPVVSTTALSDNNVLTCLKCFFRKLCRGFIILFKIFFFLIILNIIGAFLEWTKR